MKGEMLWKLSRNTWLASTTTTTRASTFAVVMSTRMKHTAWHTTPSKAVPFVRGMSIGIPANVKRGCNNGRVDKW
jgi:hypothetical protein